MYWDIRMMTYPNSKDFSSFDGKIWLNSASEGALPRASDEALREAVEWKSKPYLLTIPRFVSAQKDLKDSLGRLLNLPARDMILGNSASHGLHLLANGIPWKKGDEVLLMQDDFPTDILPWLALQQRGVKVRQLVPRDKVLEPGELKKNITRQTRLVCLPHVHTFSGVILDIRRLAEMCAEQGIIFVLNITQSVGTMPLDFSGFPVDAIVAAGYKWLCGPYGTGFAWINPALRDQLDVNRAYWPAVLSETELQSNGELKYKATVDARKFDVFGTANFFNFVPFRAAIDYWIEAGMENVRAYHDRLIDRLITGIDREKYNFISPEDGSRRSSLVVISHKDQARNAQIKIDLMAQGIYTAYWRGHLRLSPHVYNTEQEIETTAETLNGIGK